MKKKYLSIMLVTVAISILAGCSSKTNEANNNLQESIEETSTVDNYTQSPANTYNPDTITEISDSQNNDFPIQNSSENDEYLSETSNIRIISSAYDSIWLREDTDTGESYIVHVDIDGKILDKMNWVDNIYNYGYGTDGSLYIAQDSDTHYFKIYDVALQKEVTNEFINNNENIISCTQTENGYILTTREIVDSFEEKYASLRLIDTSKNELFSIQLDQNTLSNKYNMSGNETPETTCFGYAGNNVFYLAYISSFYEDEVNSLVIDLTRNSVMPVTFPQKNGDPFCISDGEHSIIYSMTHGMIILDHSTGIYSDYYIEQGYSPANTTLSSGVFLAKKDVTIDQELLAFMSWSGGIAIDLNQYPRPVKNAEAFINGKALIEFEGNYVTFIDENGEILFEPVQGCARIDSYYPYKNILVIDITDENSNLISVMEMDDNGNTSPLEIPMAQNYSYILIESNGSLYWISDANSTFQVQKSSLSQ